MTPTGPHDIPTDANATEHLWNAAHEMLEAMRKLVDAADELVEQQRQRPRDAATAPRLRRIDIDAQ
jgi:hypothetical protein